VKKPLFILLFLIHTLVFCQSDRYYYQNYNILKDKSITLDTAKVFTESGKMYFDKRVGNSLIAGGVFLGIGTISTIIGTEIKIRAEELEKIRIRENTKTAFRAIGYAMYGISAICFITAGIQYKTQLWKQENIKIRAAPTSVTMTYNF